MLMKDIKLWFDLYWEDVSGLIFGFILVMLVYAFVYILPPFIRENSIEKYDSETFGVFNSLEEIKGIKNSQEGNKLITTFYDVNYSYKIGDSTYNSFDKIQYNQVSIKEKTLLRLLQKGDTLSIRYNSLQPHNSILETKNLKKKKTFISIDKK